MKKFFTLIAVALIANFAMAQVTVTFNVNMATYTETFDEVYIAGSIAAIGAWTEPGTDAAYKMTDDDEDGIYTFVATGVDTDTIIEYKYFAGTTGNVNWDAGEWAGGDNRSIEIADVDYETADIWGDIENNQLAMNEISTSISVYPNPSNGVFTVELNERADVQVMNILGSVVYRQELSAFKNVIDLSSQASGVYFVNVNGEVTKIVIK